MPMGYCQNLYCIGLSQDNHCKYITLAQIGLILVNGLVVLKLIFIIAKRKKKKKEEEAGFLGTKIQLIFSSQSITHPVLQVWVQLA